MFFNLSCGLPLKYYFSKKTKISNLKVLIYFNDIRHLLSLQTPNYCSHLSFLKCEIELSKKKERL